MTRFIPHPDVLRRVPPLAWLTDEQAAKVLPSIQYRSYPSRTMILRAGDCADGLHILLAGSVLLLHETSAGREFCAATLGPNEFFGELGLFDHGPYSASVQARTSCEVAFVPAAIAVECLESNTRAAMCMLRKLVTRLNQAHGTMAKLALLTVGQRVAHLILENSEDVGGECVVSVGSEQMASMAGASREMVSRVTRTLIDTRIVQRHKRKLVVIDREALNALAMEAA
ncbi:MAG TPA: Crp/Fnr family transcriptional regulator [Burkholderiales bacterium]|nr:Crp/Fnr family transcriptional regulator [Burkholderiales bacterium]